ncbi:MAG: acyclic terpene utilization AtuA family protein [Acetobacteraceae bacterium]
MGDVFHVGNGAGFSGDRVDAPGPVVDTLIASGQPSALFLEVLGERTVALAQLERRRDPSRGYEPMLERLLGPVLTPCARNGVAILGNFGGANPPAAAALLARMALEQGLPDLRIAIVEGDDVRETLDFDTLDVHEADASIAPMSHALMVAANAYLGAAPLVEALAAGAQIVVAGRVADPSLALAPLIHHFGWQPDDWPRIAAGTMAGHLLECGSQVTGGVFYDPGRKDVPNPANLGFPIAEVARDGGIVITKAANTGGLVDARTVKEQLLYELHDPAAYLTPDVELDITQVTVAELAPNRVAVRGAVGRPAPERLKVTASFEGSFLGEGEFSLAGPNCLARARSARDVLLERLAMRKLPVRARIDLIGIASVHDDDGGHLARAWSGAEPSEIRVRPGGRGRVPRRRGPGRARSAGDAVLRPGRQQRRALERDAADPDALLPGAAVPCDSPACAWQPQGS